MGYWDRVYPMLSISIVDDPTNSWFYPLFIRISELKYEHYHIKMAPHQRFAFDKAVSMQGLYYLISLFLSPGRPQRSCRIALRAIMKVSSKLLSLSHPETPPLPSSASHCHPRVISGRPGPPAPNFARWQQNELCISNTQHGLFIFFSRRQIVVCSVYDVIARH